MLILDGITEGGFDEQSKTSLAQILQKTMSSINGPIERGTYQTWSNLISRCHKLDLLDKDKLRTKVGGWEYYSFNDKNLAI